MDTTSLYDRFRSDVFDTREPFLWSDDEVFQYMDAAYKQFVRLTGGVADASSDLTQLAVSAGDPWVSLDPRIIDIRRASLQSTGREVTVTNHASLGTYVAAYDYGMPKPPRIDSVPGPVKYLVTDMEQDRGRLVQVPQANDVIELVVHRLPLKPIKGKGEKLSDVHEQHHEYLLLWMKKLAYSKQDAETRNDKLVERFDGEFRLYCEQAKRERALREHKVRTVAYGGL